MKILVVEDQRRLADSIAKGLRQEKYDVHVAYDGVTAWEKITHEKYHIVLLDWMVPGKSGPEILSLMREKNITIPVIFLTAKSQIDDKIETFQLGADDYVVKPFDFSELLARIEAQLRRPQTYLSPTLTINDLTLDTKTKTVSRAGKNITLSHTEYRLLEYLLRSPEHTKSESQILDNVWDYADDSLSNKVSVYIRYLRNKIDRPFPNSPALIHTVRGLGYKISENE